MNHLVISDLQIPFEHPHALSFCKSIKVGYNIPDNNVYCVGDEFDKYWAGLYRKDPDSLYTSSGEVYESIKRIKLWYDVFPTLKLCESNHGTRDRRLAFESGIPSIMMRQYRDVIECPKTWLWQKRWRVESKYPFMVEHGDDYSGQFPHVQAAICNGMSTAIGHYHAKAGVEYIRTAGLNIWAAASGCLINEETYAFQYAKNHKYKPVLGVTVILGDGQRAYFEPLR